MQNSHYFKSDPQLDHAIQLLDYELQGRSFAFKTDRGVFSRERVDHGTDLMLKAVLADLSSLQEGTFPSKCLDLGCGYGVVSICLNSFWPDQIWQGFDVNPRALDLAKDNANRSGLDIAYFLSDGIAEICGTFELILLNPPIRAGKEVCYRLFSEAAGHLSQEGYFYLVIQNKQGARSAFKFLQSLFLDVEVIDKSSGYHTIRCRH